MKEVLLLMAILAEAPVPGQLTESEMVQVVTHGGQPVDRLAPVAVNRIDGNHQKVPASGFMIEPGIHSLNGRATLDTSSCPISGEYTVSPAPDLEVEFEAGRTYYIAYDCKSNDSAEWRLVVWKVE